MKKKNVLSKIVVSLIMIMLFAAGSSVYAATTASPLYFGITELQMKDTPRMGYAIGNPGSNGTTGNAAKIWNIVKYTSSTSNDPTAGNFYCVKAGVGFTQGSAARAPYNVFYDMKKERNEIKAQNDILSKLVTVNLSDGTNRYDALLALLDMLYLTGESTAAERTALLEAANIYAEDYPYYPIKDDDIRAIQQAAIWYFTNYGEESGKYDKTGDADWLNYTLNGTTYGPLANYKKNDTDEGPDRDEQAMMLYDYLINTAKANANKYTNVSSTGAPAQVVTTSLNHTESGSNYVMGPIRINENSSNPAPYTIDFVVKNNGITTTSYTLLDENKNAVTSGKTVKDLVGKDFYISMPKASVGTLTIDIAINYSDTTMTLWASSTNSQEQPIVVVKKEPKSVPVKLTFTPEEEKKEGFDLALRKYITKVNGTELESTKTRVPNIDESTLTSGTTATYKHRKDPIVIQTGDVVTYKLTIYNEGNKDGRATKLVDQLPTGLKFKQVISGNFELDSYTETDNTLNLKRKASNTDNLAAYTSGNLKSETIEIECEVTATPHSANTKVLTNVAWISEEYDAEDNLIITNQVGKDRDSEPSTKPSVNKDNMSDYKGNGNKNELSDSNYFYKGQQDDDDFEKLVILPEVFDLKLIKRIVEVNGEPVPERIKNIDVSELNKLDENGNMSTTTGDYDLNKDPVFVSKGDIVTYTFRIYNEGTINGYAKEITEDVPEGLEFVWSEKEGTELEEDTTLTDEEKEAIEFNQGYLWGKFVYDDEGKKIIQVSTDYLSKEKEVTPGENLIDAFGKNDGTKTEADLSYKEISIKFKVVSDNITGAVIRNEAAITDDSDEDGEDVDDRDSDTEDWVKYEDDEDFDNITLKSFDLALRKFIIAVSRDTVIDESEYLKNADGSYKRAPIVDTSKLNTKDSNGKMITTAEYNHTKEPVVVIRKDIVIYNLRVYNEGDIDGYASEIKDHLPPNLEYVSGEFNDKYGWEVSEDGRTVTTNYLKDHLIKKAEKDSDGVYVLSYKEVPIMCRVKDEAITNENITNIADITEYLDENEKPIKDRDSEQDNVKLPEDKDLPGYKEDEKGPYVPGQQDDDDFEKVIVRKFDLALRKWVTQAIVIEDGKETVIETGHQPYDDPEGIVKVEIHKNKLDKVIVKFRYSIRVINEGDIEGYAKEVTDYIPEGLRFIAEDNPGWTEKSPGVIATRLLENTLLKPGEFADVQVLLTWINNSENLGLKVNIAEISEDWNEFDVPDEDSTPDNKKPGEDDIDDAPVMLSLKTGTAETYLGLTAMILVTIAGGVFLIKKYVL